MLIVLLSNLWYCVSSEQHLGLPLRKTACVHTAVVVVVHVFYVYVKLVHKDKWLWLSVTVQTVI